MASTAPLPPQPEGDIKTKDNTSTDAKAANSDVEKQKQEPQSPPCCETAQSRLSAFSSLGFLDRFLAVWIFLAMLIGILLGNFVDNTGPALQKGKFVDVSVPIGKLNPTFHQHIGMYANWVPAIGLLVMMYPILCKVQYEKLHEVFQAKEIWVQMGFSIIINWIIAPLVMVSALALTW
jgi:ACR3 family arsenite transporter